MRLAQLFQGLLPKPKLNLDPQTQVLLLDVDGVLITPDDFYGAKLARENGDVMREFMRGPFQSASTGKSDLLEHLPAFMAQIGRNGEAADFYREWLEYENRPNLPMLDAVRGLRAAGAGLAHPPRHQSGTAPHPAPIRRKWTGYPSRRAFCQL